MGGNTQPYSSVGLRVDGTLLLGDTQACQPRSKQHPMPMAAACFWSIEGKNAVDDSKLPHNISNVSVVVLAQLTTFCSWITHARHCLTKHILRPFCISSHQVDMKPLLLDNHLFNVVIHKPTLLKLQFVYTMCACVRVVCVLTED